MTRLVLAQEHDDLRVAVRSWLTAHDVPDHWRTGAAGMGLLGLHVPDALGGSGAPFTATCVVAHELGRVVAAVPFLSTSVLATSLLLASADAEAQAYWLPRLCGEAARAAVPHLPSEVSAVVENGQCRVSGSVDFVIDGAEADILFLQAEATTGPTIVGVPLPGAGTVIKALPTMDLTRPQARLTMRDSPGVVVGEIGSGAPIMQAARNCGMVALAWELVGVAERALEIAVDHAKSRFQFGRPIGSFQAIKHRCADMQMRVELSRATALHAAWACEQDPGARPRRGARGADPRI
jgi:alkylation response protein AidB-like acyl-CoA dehydrogenase